MVSINGTNFSPPVAHFDTKCLFSDERGQNIWKYKTYLKNEDIINQKVH